MDRNEVDNEHLSGHAVDLDFGDVRRIGIDRIGIPKPGLRIPTDRLGPRPPFHGRIEVAKPERLSDLAETMRNLLFCDP